MFGSQTASAATVVMLGVKTSLQYQNNSQEVFFDANQLINYIQNVISLAGSSDSLVKKILIFIPAVFT